MKSTSDFLFLERGCPDCARIVAKLDIDVVHDDDFRTKDGNEFLVITSQSNNATEELFKLLPFVEHGTDTTPLLVSADDGEKTSDATRILYLLGLRGIIQED